MNLLSNVGLKIYKKLKKIINNDYIIKKLKKIINNDDLVEIDEFNDYADMIETSEPKNKNQQIINLDDFVTASGNYTKRPKILSFFGLYDFGKLFLLMNIISLMNFVKD